MDANAFIAKWQGIKKYTGGSAEAAVKALIMSLKWNVATDEIDAGHDFCVTPEIERFGGLNFFAQVNGTRSSRKRDVAARARIRNCG
jgi:hypothetical protein